MSTLRQLLAEQIKTDNPGFIVTDYPTGGPENIPRNKTVVQVYRQSFEPAANGTQLLHTFEIVVLVAKQGTAYAEDDLEASLDSVLLSLERFPGLTYTQVTRDVIGNYNGYVITAARNTENYYKNIVREEQKAV